MAENSNYEVGYGKPPKDKRFAKGRSGNPTGRPKGTKNVATILQKISRQLVKVSKGGRAVHMSRLEASLEQLANKAASGDLKAIREFLYWLRAYAEMEQSSESVTAFDEKDKPALANVMKRFLRQNAAAEIGCQAEESAGGASQ